MEYLIENKVPDKTITHFSETSETEKANLFLIRPTYL